MHENILQMSILFVFNFGSELRQFYYSGVIHELIKRRVEVNICTKVEVKELFQVVQAPVNWIPFSAVRIPPLLILIKKVLDESHPTPIMAWKYGVVGESKGISLLVRIFLTLIAKVKIGRTTLLILERFTQKIYYSRSWSKILRDNRIDRVVVNVPNINFPLLLSCHHLHIPVILLYHTNKDVVAQGRISYSYSFYGVWNSQMSNSILAVNSKIDPCTLSVIGSTHFLYLLNKSKVARDGFLDRYNLPSDKKIVTYVAASPGVIQGEHEYIYRVKKALQSISKDFHIVVRTNPMDNTGSWLTLSDDFITVIPSQWFYDAKRNFNFPYPEDLKLVNGLLDLTTICIGIPSTFVVECALKKVPVVNICFDTNQSHAVMGSMISYWDAPFYKNARESFFANGVFNENDLSKVLEEVLLFDQDKVAVAAGEFLNREFGVLGDEVRTRTVNSIIG
jgi:hypothetical protein